MSDSYTRNIAATVAKVLLKDGAGMPFLTVNRYGKGKVLFCNAAIETAAPLSAEGIYRLAAREAGVNRAVTVDNPSIGLTEHRLNDNVLLVVAINYEPREVAGKLTLKGRVGKVYRGAVEDGLIRVGANDAAVFEVR